MIKYQTGYLQPRRSLRLETVKTVAALLMVAAAIIVSGFQPTM